MIVDIPENFLVIIGAYGKMGDGDLPDTMRYWAQKTCIENGLESKLKEFQEQNIFELKKRIAKIQEGKLV